MSDLISIIVPVYNAGSYLEQCVRSILGQTVQHIEILLVDDGSTDGSAQLCDAFQQMDKRIQVLHQRNGGSVSARKTGLKMAKGKYIGFVDADDYIEAEMFERLSSIMNEVDVDFVHSGMIIDDRKICNYEEGVVELSARDKAEYMSQNVFLPQTISYALWSKLFKAELIKEAYMHLPDEQSYGEDLLCLCSYILKSSRFYMMKDAFYHYRVYDGSLSHMDWVGLCIEESKLYSQIMSFMKRKGLISKCGESVKERYKRRILQAMTTDPSHGIRALHYLMPDSVIQNLKGKKVIIYGAGRVGKDFYSQMTRENDCELVAWVDGKHYGTINLIEVEQPEILRRKGYDIILLAVNDEQMASDIKQGLMAMGIKDIESKILWEKPVSVW